MDLIEQVHRWIIGAPTSYQMKSSCYKRFREFAVLEIDKSGSLGVNENGASLLSLEYAMEYSEREIKKLYNSSKGYIIPCDRFSIVDIASSRRRRMVFLGSVEAKKDPLIETIQIYKNSLDDERAVVTFRINLRSCVRSAKEAFDYIDANGYRNAIRDSYPLITKEFMQHIYTRECFYETLIEMLGNALYTKITRWLFIPYRYRQYPQFTINVFDAPKEISTSKNLVLYHHKSDPNMGTYMKVERSGIRIPSHRWEFFCNEPQRVPVTSYLMSTIGEGMFFYLAYEWVVRDLRSTGFDLTHRIWTIMYKPLQVLRIHTSMNMNKNLRMLFLDEYHDDKGIKWSAYVNSSVSELILLTQTYLNFINGYSIQVFNVVLILIAFISILISVICN